MAGKLFLCATPIGNLEDITYRVLRTLKEADLIAAEDTRHTLGLLNHFEIKTPMTSYHEYNKVDKARVLVDKMREGTNIALVTDAGTPGISDPGEELVRQCYEAGIELTDEETDRIADVAVEYLRGVLNLFGETHSSIDEYDGKEGELILDVSGGNLAVLIGRHGRTLEALQTVITTLLSSRLKFYYPIVVDIESYRSRAKKKIEQMALNAASRAKSHGSSVKLAPMNAYDRRLVHLALRGDAEVTSLPGPAACITALTMSGLPTRRFCFEAFLPAEKADRAERARILEELARETRTIVLYEAPHHLKKTLEDLYGALGDRKISFCRELTKLHETVMQTTLGEALQYYRENEPRGEYVLVIAGKSIEEVRQEAAAVWESMNIPEHMEYYLQQGTEKKEAMKRVAKDRGISKREVYAALLEE